MKELNIFAYSLLSLSILLFGITLIENNVLEIISLIIIIELNVFILCVVNHIRLIRIDELKKQVYILEKIIEITDDCNE